MNFRIKEHFWSWGDDFTITDARGMDRFRVDGQAFSCGTRMYMCAMSYLAIGITLVSQRFRR